MRRNFMYAMALAAILCAASPASAFLSLVRQGAESAEVPNTNDRFGRTVCSGDFDGDGIDDLATAAPDEANGLINSAAHGMVIISRGSSRGITSQGARTLSVGDLGTEAARFGGSLTSADFDQDGYDDLAVGIPQLNNFGGPDRGAVWIYRGGAGGLQVAPYLQIYYDDVEVFQEDYANFGWALTSGDFNDDGFPDIATSAIGQDNDTGVLYFFFGSNEDGITTDGFQKMYPYTAGGSQAAGGRFGWSLAAGQLDGTGGDDLVVGAPWTAVHGLAQAGRAYFYYAGATGISGTGAWYIDSNNMGAVSTDTNARLGYSVAVGHMYQVSGQEDVAVGAPQDDYGAQSSAGSVILVEFNDQANDYDSMKKLRQHGSTNSTNASPGDQFGFSLAVGRWDVGNFEDLAIGAPYDDVLEQTALGVQSNAGVFHVLRGQENGPSMSNSETFDAVTLNNFVNAGDNLGHALAFGRFDATSREGLAVGAPNADYDSYESGGTDVSNAGQVHIVAPWRQPKDQPHRASVSFDCDGFIVYGQRPFQRVRPASTTKTLTLMLACDAIYDGDVDPNQFYQIPGWVANQVGGSQADLVEGEQLTFAGLMQTMMTVSGNDSAMLIGSILSGDGGPWEGWSDTSPAFAAMMNTKVNQLGLGAAVQMTNAAGIDSGDHYVTALDWATLAYLAIQNDCVKTIVNQSPWIVERILPAGSSLDFFQVPGDPGNGEIHMFDAFFAGWVDGVKGRYPAAVGIKPGLTPGGWGTGISAADPFGKGHSAASSFGSRRTDVPVEGVTAGSSSRLNADLLKLAEGFCDDGMPSNDFLPTPPGDPKPWGVLTSIPACPDEGVHAMSMNLVDEQTVTPGRVIQFDLTRRTHVEPRIPVRQMIERTSQVTQKSGTTIPFGVAPHQRNAGVEIQNMGERNATLEVSWGRSLIALDLAPGETATLPPITDVTASFNWSIFCTGIDALLVINELGYQYDVELHDGLTAGDSFSVALTRGGDPEFDDVSVSVRGLDDDCDGDVLDLVARADDGIPTGVESGGGLLPAAPATFQLLPNHPNPFNPTTTIRFDLPRAASVDLAIYDLRGRLVRNFARGRDLQAGRHAMQWNGTDETGATVASGVYILKLVSDGFQQTQRMTLLK